VTNDLTVSLRLPYVLRTDIREAHVHGDEAEVHARGDSEGLGDLSAMAQWRFFNNQARGTEAALLLGVKAPTGETDETDVGANALTPSSSRARALGMACSGSR
jgi:hypothetical protein